MTIVVTGAGGFLGSRLVKALLARPGVEKIVALDAAFPVPPEDPRVEVRVADVSDKATVDAAITPGTRSVFHLAAVVSSAAEADFDLGMRVNLDGMRHVLEACRRLGTCPRLVYTSSVAVFGGALPPVVTDETPARPDFSYGLQKLIGEQLVDEYTRRGWLDGRSPRLPTIVVRPGRPNSAASSFASSIVREPMEGRDYACPVGPETPVWVLSPRRVVEAFLALHDLDGARLGRNRAVNLPGITTSVAEMLQAVGAVAGPATAARVGFAPDDAIGRIVASWPTAFRTERADALGLKADESVADIVREFAATDMAR